MIDIKDRVGILSGLVNSGIRRYFKENPQKDKSEDIERIENKLDELTALVERLVNKSGETVIELDTKE